MRIAITGANGLLGHGLAQWFGRNHEVTPLTRDDADITSPDAILRVVAAARPDVVIHAAATPDMDLCETNPSLCHAVNVAGTRNVADAARSCGAIFAFISSDAIFDGRKAEPYTETDEPNPVTIYARSKVEGEKIAAAAAEHFIFRVPVLFGPGKGNFVSKGLDALRAGQPCVGPTDQVGGALYTLDAGQSLEQVIGSGRFGLYHISNSGFCSRYELLGKAAMYAGLDPRHISPRTRTQIDRPAPRLPWMGMDMLALDGIGVPRPRPWQEALADYIEGLPEGLNPEVRMMRRGDGR